MKKNELKQLIKEIIKEDSNFRRGIPYQGFGEEPDGEFDFKIAIKMAAMSHLSDLQEEHSSDAKLVGVLNFVKSLILKLNGGEMTQDELDQLYHKYVK